MSMEAHYNPFLVLLSVAVAVLASYVALNLAHSVTQARGKAHLLWLTCGSLAMGIGIWSMHFVGMLAFEMPGMEMAYDVPLMVLSMAVAVFGSALALYVVSRPQVFGASILSGGIAMAVAISGMHYIGMYSMRMSARIEWNLYLVALSVVIALGASLAALLISFRLRDTPEKFRLLLLASVIMGFAIAGMHYTGMIAATFIHDSSLTISDSNLLVTSGLTFATLSGTLLLLCGALATSVFERVWFHRQKLTKEFLETSEEKYRLLIEAVKDYAIFIVDPDTRIRTWNSGAEKLTGYQSKEIIGSPLAILYGPNVSEYKTAEEELHIARTKGHFETDAIRTRRDGTQFWANIVIDPLYDKDGKVTGFSKVLRDVTLLKEAEQRTRTINEELELRVKERTIALHETAAQLRTITNAIPTLVAQVDRNQKFLFANDAFCDWFQQSQQSIQELTFRDILGDDRYEANLSYIQRALSGETVSYERLSVSRGREAILNITFVPEFDSNGTSIGFIIVASNVSQYKEIENALKAAKEEAEVANRAKSAFLANMSHEIRTPLGAIMGFSELMTDASITEEEKKNGIEIIKRNGKLLFTIINDILDLSKVEAGKLTIEISELAVKDLIEETIALLRLEATNKKIDLSYTFQGDVPQKVKTDPTRIRQILFNIVGNAVKFTEKGSVHITVSEEKSSSPHLLFDVKDTGTGIAKEHAQRLFSPFMQGDATTTRKFGGTGLGLALSKKLAQALGGDVKLIESTLGQGSTFQISIASSTQEKQESLITKKSPNFPQPLLSEPSTSGKNLMDHNVLVVDDSPDNLELIQRILKIAGAKVSIVDNGKDAINIALSDRFSVILMDLQMPGMDGYQATQTLRERGFTKPIIALTAHAMKEVRERCLESGFTDHLTKPIDKNSLLNRISELSV